MARPRTALVALLALCLAALLFGACRGADEGDPSERMPGSAKRVDDPFAGSYPLYRDSVTGLRVILGTPDLGRGPSRIAFALFDDGGLVEYPGLLVRTYYYPDGPEAMRLGPLEQTVVDYHQFPLGGRGTFSGTVDLASAGLWGIEVAVPRPDGSIRAVLFPVTVKERAKAPAVGGPAPRSQNRIASDVASLAELTTSSEPDPALYGERITQALDRGRPFVVTFASPAFCTTALCGPQVETLSELVPEWGAAFSFIHVDLYENPHEIKGDLGRARRSPLLEEWGIESDQWTFVVGRDGRIAARFESYVAREELEAALQAALK